MNDIAIYQSANGQPIIFSPEIRHLSYTDLDRWMKDNRIYKVPEPMYQNMFTTFQKKDYLGVEEVQRLVRVQLDYWLREDHPDEVLESFIDLRNDEARMIHRGLEWGMYVKLLPKRPIMGIQKQMENPTTRGMIEFYEPIDIS